MKDKRCICPDGAVDKNCMYCKEYFAKKPINNIKQPLLDAFQKECKNNIFGNALNMYQRLATGTANYPGKDTPLGLIYVALKGAGEAGEFAEHVGKAMRDDAFGQMGVRHENGTTRPEMFGELTPERRALLIKECGDQLWYIAAKCNELGVTLSEAALINVLKLKDRQERNTLNGSGDER